MRGEAWKGSSYLSFCTRLYWACALLHNFFKSWQVIWQDYRPVFLSVDFSVIQKNFEASFMTYFPHVNNGLAIVGWLHRSETHLWVSHVLCHCSCRWNHTTYTLTCWRHICRWNVRDTCNIYLRLFSFCVDGFLLSSVATIFIHLLTQVKESDQVDNRDFNLWPWPHHLTQGCSILALLTFRTR